MLYNHKDIKNVDYQPEPNKDRLVVTITFYSNRDEEKIVFPLDTWRDRDSMVIPKVGQFIKENL